MRRLHWEDRSYRSALAPTLEQPRQGFIKLVNIPAVLVKMDEKSPREMQVGHLELELHTLLVALSPQCFHLLIQCLHRFGDCALKLDNLCVSSSE